MRQNLPLLLCIALCLSSACSHYYYAPNSLQTPFLQQKHDTRASIGFIGGNEFSGWEASACFSPVKYGAVLFNHFQVQHAKPDDNPERKYGNGRLTEFALGAYNPIKKNMSLSLFAGWGGGQVFNAYGNGGVSNLRFERIFLQPGMMIQGKRARFGVATRFNRLNYVSGEVDLGIPPTELNAIRSIENVSPIYFSELGFVGGFGAAPVWVDFRINLNNKESLHSSGFATSTAGISIQFELDYFWRKTEANRPMNSFNTE